MKTPADVLSGAARWCVVHGDCLDVMKTLPDKSVAHVITDPPYSRDLYLRFRSNGGVRAKGKTGREDRKAHRELASLRIGAADDVAGPAVEDWCRVAVRWMLAFHDAESGELWRKAFGPLHVRCGVWVKPNPMPQISGDRPAQGFESLEIAHAKGRKRWNGGGLPAVWTHLAIQGNWSERAENDHPCPKPVSLMMELVEQFTDPDDVVLDSFCGSGTTGVACLRLGRRFIGIEKDAKYAALATERLEAESKGLTLKDARVGQLSLLG